MIVKKIFNFPTYIFLIIIGGLLFIPILGAVPLFDKDEIFYAAIAKEMLLSGNWLQPNLNHQPIYSVGPLFGWMQALSMEFLGTNAFAARFPNAVCGIVTVLVIYRIGKRLYSPYFGLIWCLVYIGSFVPQFYYRTSLAEPWFNLFIFLAIYHISRILAVNQEPGEFYRRSDIKNWLIYAAFFTAAAMLIKGYVGFILVYATIFVAFVFSLAKSGMGYLNFFKWLVLVFAIFSMWLWYDAYHHGFSFAWQFLSHQWNTLGLEHADENNFWYYHVLILLAGCFPASAFVFQGFKNTTYEPVYQKMLRQMMVSSLFVVVIFYTITRTNIIHYSSAAYLPISFLATLNINRIINGEIKWKWPEYTILFLIGLFWSIVLIGIPSSGAHINIIKPVIQDRFVISMLQGDVHWDQNEMLFGIIFSFFFAISYLLFLLKKNIAAVLTLFISTGYMTQILVYYFVPKIENHTQGALIEFCKTKSEEGHQVVSFGDVTYAPLFYDSNQPVKPASTDQPKESYLISFVQDTSDVKMGFENYQTLFQKNDYLFWVKKE